MRICSYEIVKCITGNTERGFIYLLWGALHQPGQHSGAVLHWALYGQQGRVEEQETLCEHGILRHSAD